ncbi:fumarate hydratase C-terminal domain-containing protein [Paradesulfitobacterium ferrireducens]|uniref:fumarate hydratase C-terminal domain-containing protein n=1 Tax=Paradesulfitobacterium ferrireducens TaxID=2816476 RepID=UPI001A9062FA|nr:fumarate hydratase C-terminal domain-containing protein [Paradesulfitobacterium ferrireducens]
MADAIKILAPVNRDQIRFLKAGDNVLISGSVYTGMHTVQQKLVETLTRGEQVNVDLRNHLFYFVGPTPAKPGRVIGSAGPEASGWIDKYSPQLLAQGLSGIIGTWVYTPVVIDAVREHGAVYFGAIGGVGALYSKRIVSTEVVAYPELGPEAIYRIELESFPAVVIIDSQGNNLYESAKAKYRRI